MRTCLAALAARCGASVVARSFYLLLTSGPTAPEREKNPTPQRFFSPHPDPPVLWALPAHAQRHQNRGFLPGLQACRPKTFRPMSFSSHSLPKEDSQNWKE